MIENILVEILATASAARFSAQHAARVASAFQLRTTGELRRIVIETTLMELYAHRLLREMLSKPNEWRDAKQSLRVACAALRTVKKTQDCYRSYAWPLMPLYMTYLAALRTAEHLVDLAETKVNSFEPWSFSRIPWKHLNSSIERSLTNPVHKEQS